MLITLVNTWGTQRIWILPDFLAISKLSYDKFLLFPMEKGMNFIWTNTQEHFVPNVNCWNWPFSSGEEDLYISTYLVYVLLLFSPFRKRHSPETLYLNKLEATSYKDNLYQVWLEWAQWFWRTWFFC